METLEKESKFKIAISILIISALLLEIIVIPRFFPDYSSILNLLIWIVIAVLSRNLENQHNNFKSKRETFKTVFIIILV